MEGRNILYDQLVDFQINKLVTRAYYLEMQPSDIILVFAYVVQHQFAIQSGLVFSGRRLYVIEEYLQDLKDLLDELGIRYDSVTYVQRLIEARNKQNRRS